MYLPEFVQQYKEPRTEIRKIADKFYKYEVAFVYNLDEVAVDIFFEIFRFHLKLYTVAKVREYFEKIKKIQLMGRSYYIVTLKFC